MEVSRSHLALCVCLAALSAGAYAGNDAVTIDAPRQHLFMEVARDGTWIGVMGHGAVDFQPQAVIAGKQRIPLTPGEPRASGTQVTQTLGAGITGWYTTGAKGVEQGFTFAKPLGGDRISIELGLAGRLEPQQWKGGWYFAEARDPLSALRYGDLAAYDATHKHLPMSIAVRHGLLTLTVDARHARYPLTLDPFLSFFPVVLDAPAGLSYSSSLRVSSDGKVVIVGAPFAHTNSGEAYSFIKSGSTWVGPVEIMNPEGAHPSFFGNSVALSGDGMTALVGAPSYGAVLGPLVYIYERSGTSWTPAGILTTNGAAQVGSAYGQGLAISRDGKTALVGAPDAHGNNGAVYAYHLVGGAWGSPQTLPAPAASSEEEGVLAALSSGGTTAVAAAPGMGTSAGAVLYAYTYDGSAWSSPVALTALPSSGTGAKITGIALSGDGTQLVAGDPDEAHFNGAAYSYAHGSGGWTGPARLSTVGVPNSALFGLSLALSEDGARLLVGAPQVETNVGAEYFYTRSGTTWTGQTALFQSNPGSDVNFGYTAGLDAAGNTLFIGTKSTVYVYGAFVDFSLSGTSPSGLVAPGSDVTLKYALGNTDTETITDLVLKEVLPAGATYESSGPNGGHCSYASATGTVTCTLASLAGGKSGTQAWQPSITFKTPDKAAVLHNEESASADQQLAGIVGMGFNFTNDADPVASGGSLKATSATAASGALSVTPGFTDQKLSYTLVTKPSHGSVMLDASTGDFTYTSAKGFTGKDTFRFSAGDGIVTSNQATETITVSAASSGDGGSGGSGKSSGGGGLDILVSMALFGVYLRRRRRI